MENLNLRQKEFVRKITQEMKPKSVAYAEVYGGEASDPNVQSMASRLSSNVKVKATLEEIEKTMKDEAAEAYLRNKTMAQDPMTPANVRNDINKHIMALGGVIATTKVESVIENKYPELDNMTSEQLKGILDQVDKPE